MPSEGLEPAIPAVKRLQTYALDRAATGIGLNVPYFSLVFSSSELASFLTGPPFDPLTLVQWEPVFYLLHNTKFLLSLVEATASLRGSRV